MGAQDKSIRIIQDTTATSNNKEHSGKVQLKKQLGLVNGISIIVGVIVGSGIFVTPKGVLEDAGSTGAALIVWALCGFVSLIGALCFAELGTSITASGGDYSYLWLAYGPLPSFLYLWVTMLIIIPGGNAVSALTFANYILQPIYCESEDVPPGYKLTENMPPDNVVRLVAFFILLTLIFINCYSVRWSLWLQDSFTLTKVLALALVIGFGIHTMATGNSKSEFSFEPLPMPANVSSQSNDTSQSDGSSNGSSPASFTLMAQAFYSGLYSYAGWNALNFVTEELKNPIKNLPRAISISILIVTSIYVLANMSYFAVLTIPQIRTSKAIAVTFGNQVLGYAKWIMPLSVALSTTSGLNACIFSSSRVLFVGARHGQLTEFLSFINVDRLTPVPSLIFLGAMSMVYVAVSTQVNVLINYLIFIEALFLGLSVSTVIRLRYLKPDLIRPIRVNILLPVLYLAVTLFLIIVPTCKNFTGAAVGCAITLTGIPVYYCTVNWKNKPIFYRSFLENLSRLIQKLTMSVKPDFDDDQDEIATIKSIVPDIKK